MLELKDEEDGDQSISLDMAKFLDFLCKNKLGIQFGQDDENRSNFAIVDEYSSCVEGFETNRPFSDLYYPKNLLRTLREKLSEECPTE